jgi:hypothetical protein
MSKFVILIAFCLGSMQSYSQSTDTAKRAKENTVHTYFIISAGTQINAYFNDKPVDVETISEFNDYVQKNVKVLRDSWVIVSGKPKTGTFDDVLKTLGRNKFKHVTKEIIKDP